LGKLRKVMARRKDGTEFPCEIGIRNVSHNGQGLMVGFVRNITNELEAMEMAIDKQVAEDLLVNMLPEEVAQRLKEDPGHIADHFSIASVLFADIVGFTTMANEMEPIAVVALLNDLFSRFDEALDKYGLNKVKTIGDCYMVTSIPGTKDQPKACAAVCHFAMDLIEELEKYNLENPINRPLNIRVGINCGPVVAGVVGKKRFMYDIWGHAVNMASRMESMGVPGRIQVSKEIIENIPGEEFDVERRGMVHVKGIGEVETFFLKDRQESRGQKYWVGVKQERATDGRMSRSLEILRQETV
jgi:adenylate cyclase